MTTKPKVFFAFILGIIVAIAVPFLLLASGVIDWSASSPPTIVEQKLANWAFIRSMASRAPQSSNPIDTNTIASAGLPHYKENCVACHGAPGIKPSEIGVGLNPAAPDLTDPFVRQLSDGEMFWIVKNGIRMTGMPAFGKTHDNDEIWAIIGFVRRLPTLTAEEKAKLKPQSEEEHHHHEE